MNVEGSSWSSTATPKAFDNGRLVVNHVIGTGAHSTVFKCTMAGSGELRAVKRLFQRVADVDRPSTLDEEHAVQDWCREVTAMGAIDHPNVAKYYSHFRDGAFLCIEMEYLAGGSLLEYLRAETTRRNGLPDAMAAAFVRQIVMGLAAVHRFGVVHRDLKAGNVLLSGDFKTAKLADFGLARPHDSADDDGEADLDECLSADVPPVQLEGSVFWMAPQVMLRGSSAPPHDVWSLGCLAIELLSGHPPFFEFMTKASAVFHISQLQQDPSDQWSNIPNITAEAADFVSKTMRIKARDRLSCEQLLSHAWLSSGPAEARPVQGRRSGLPPPSATAETDADASSPDVTALEATPSRLRGLSPTPTQPDASASPVDMARSSSLQNLTQTLAPADPARELLRTLERCCLPTNPELLARWLFGVDDPAQALVPTTTPERSFAVRHEGLVRAAKETVALLGNVVADAISLWRGVGPTYGASASDRPAQDKRESMRAIACAVLVHLGRVVQQWKDHAIEMARAATALKHYGDRGWSELIAIENDKLRQNPDENAALSLGLVWVLLDALASTNFWSYCDVTVMFMMDEGVSLARPGHFDPSPDRNGADCFDRSTTGSVGPDEPTWSNVDGADDDSSCLTHDDGADGGEHASDTGVHSDRSGHLTGEIPRDAMQLFHQTAAAMLALHSVSLLSIASPSAHQYASRCATAAASSGWAQIALLRYNPTRARMLRSLSCALEAERRIRGLPNAVDSVCALSILRFNDTKYLPASFGHALTDMWEPATAQMLVKNAATGSNLASMVPRTTALLDTLVQSSTLLATMPHQSGGRTSAEKVEREAFDDGTTALLCLLQPSGGGLRGGPPVTAAEAPTALRQIIDSVQAGHLLSIADMKGASESRRIARAAMVLFAYVDREGARQRLSLGPYLAAATDPTASYSTRAAAAAAMLDIIDEKTPTDRVNALLLGRAAIHGAPAAVQPFRLIATALEAKCPTSDGSDGSVDVVATCLCRFIRANHDVTLLLSDDATLLRAAVHKLRHVNAHKLRYHGATGFASVEARRGLEATRWEVLEVLRSLYQNASDPGRYCDSAELLQALLDIANDGTAGERVRVIACELLNAFASAAVF